VLRALLLWWRWRDRLRAHRAASSAGWALGLALVVAGVAEVVFTETWSGVWLALVGWFLVAAASRERAAALTGVLADQPVSVAMSAPECGYADEPVDAFVHRVAHGTRRRAFAVIDRYGRPMGTVTLAALLRMPPTVRATTRLARVVTPLLSVPTCTSTRRLAEVVPMTPPAGTGLLLVIDDGVLVGTLDTDDLLTTPTLAGRRERFGQGR
jgi:hypothetical protein